MGSATSTRAPLSALRVAPQPNGLSSAIDFAIADYNLARDRLNAAPSDITLDEEDRLDAVFTAATCILMDLVPEDAGQFARKVAALWQDDRDLPTATSFAVLLRDARAVA